MEGATDGEELKRLHSLNKNTEIITPHKIAVVVFIREFGILRREGKEFQGRSTHYRKDFCILALKLIQCPDMEFKELQSFLTSGRYHLLSAHLQNFCERLQNIYMYGIGALTDCITSTEELMIEQNEVNSCVITRNSILGLYLRRIMLYLDKLSFDQLSSLHKSFCYYYQKGRPGTIMRSLSKEKLNAVDTPEENKQVMKHVLIDKDNINFEDHQWSLRQAELFTAQQANLLQINEQRALPPEELQKIIIKIVHDLPEYPEVHFLSFLNCLRIKEFCGAQDSLYNCFDRSIFTSQSLIHSTVDRHRHFRYAALNRAALHAHFDHNYVTSEVAMEGVREALTMAQEASDAPCIAHVVAWAARAGGRGRRAALLTRTPRAPRAAPAAAAAAQFLAQHMAVNSARPSDVFSLITKGEAINYMHSMTDLTIASLANTAALWSLYGKTEMASVNCQLILNLNSKWSGDQSPAWQWSGARGAAAAGAAALAAWRGTGLPAALMLAAPSPAPAAARLAHTTRAQAALYEGKWEEADQSIKQLASFDRWESQLLKAEMYFLKQEPKESLDTLKDILDYCKTEEDSLHFMSLKLRAMLLMSQVKHAYGGINAANSTNIILLNEVLSMAKRYHLHYIAASTEMYMANVQLHMGCARNALFIVKRALPTIMAHGGAYDMARAMLLYCKCRVAYARAEAGRGLGEARAGVVQSCCEALDQVKENFAKINAHSRLLEIWYLQAQLYNEIGNTAARNNCAWMYRQLEGQHNVEPTNLFLICY